MKLRILIALAFTLMAVSACVVEPVGIGWHGDGYGHRVWRE